LKNNGFKVKYIYPNALQIEWGKNDFNTMLSIENDRGALQRLAIDNKPHTSPSLFDLKIPHKGDKMGGGMIAPAMKKTLDLGLQKPPADDIIFKFKDQNKDSRKKQIQDEKFRAINTFMPKTNIFTK
jgi:isopropylmalate/homocitrate/citramalate synthase